ncbi:hypothetical protein DFJ73DRAFT_966218 [Zopfochytrium polystomum]|nr:hypothetical protein DFJ73DRAFT_966218 [Zopfochytrium polystomum]
MSTNPIPYNSTALPDTADVLFGPTISNLINSEATPLARAEWIFFFDSFFGLRKAPTIFNNITQQYNCLRSKLAEYVGDDPVVTVISASDTPSNYSTPNRNYWYQLLIDLNVKPLLINNDSIIPLAVLTEFIPTADIFIDTSTITANDRPYTILQWTKRYGLTKTSPGYNFLDGDLSNILRTDGRTLPNGYDDFPQSANVQPELFLADLLYRLDATFNPAFTPYWLRNVAVDIAAAVNPPCENNATFVPYLNGKLCPDSAVYAPSFGRFAAGAGGASSSASGGSAGQSRNASVPIAVSLAAIIAVAAAVAGVVYLKKRGALPTLRGVGGTAGGSGSGGGRAQRKFYRMENGARDEPLIENVSLQDASTWWVACVIVALGLL